MVDIFTQEVAYKFVKFGAVGFSGVFVDFGFTYICKEWLKIQKYVSNAIGFTIAASSNYYLNRIWTFHSNNPEIAVEYGRFLLISLIGLLINTLVLWALVSKAKFNFYFAKLLAIGVVTVWNFVVNLNYTFVA
ncbi:putative flippase GtrA [Lentimicrobium saccharophilum]|uniref:Putative flippase GtrA n=1 Tax=Lentimicrobium saccharophilum TaxID=1678841 RepID=A0A0S7C7I1_9BACT|nr:GtrA family protein [Lentimicrobium saccharophilum]GAP45224.1 putative flippase GtrA [Lentimicrobium saccharophilum]